MLKIYQKIHLPTVKFMLSITSVIIGDFHRVTGAVMLVTWKHTFNVKIKKGQFNLLAFQSVEKIVAFDVDGIIAGKVG